MTQPTLARTIRPAMLAAAVPLLAILSTAFVAPVFAETTLRFVPQADLRNTDPIWTTAAITQTHGFMIYDQLFALDEEGRVQPQMIESHTVSEDGLAHTFTLREELRWHDGDPVTAADCVASIRRWGERDTMGQKLMGITKGIDVLDDRTFRLVLSRPYGLVLESFAKFDSNALFIMKAEYAGTTDAYTQIKANVGSGPFRMAEDEWIPGNKVVYLKNEDYVPREEPASWFAGGKVVRVDRVEWLYIPDAATAIAALQLGEVDYIEKPETDLIPLIARDPNIAVDPIPLVYQGWLQINHLHPPFDDPRARRALLYMVHQEDYVRAIIGDPQYFRTYCGAIFLCGSPYESEAGADALRAHDPERARALLAEAGYAGEPIVLMDPTDFPVLHGAALVTAQKLREIGVNVNVQAMDWSTLTSRRAERKPPSEGGWHIFHTWWTSGSLTRPVSHPGVSGACEKAWFGWPCDEELQRLSNAWALEPDPAERKRIALALQVRAYEVVPYVPYGQWRRPLAYRKSLRGLLITPTAVLWNVSKPE